MTHAPRMSLGAIALVSFALAGCGDARKVAVRGKLTWGGQPLQISKTTLVTITFAGAEEKTAQTYPAKFNHDDASYQVSVPTGKYRVGMLVVEQGKSARGSPMNASPIYEIQKDEEIDLQLDRQPGGKG